MMVEEIAPPNLFAGAPPAREEYVLGQGFERELAYCKGLFPDKRMWPSELDQLPVASAGTFNIDRRLVFAIAQRVVAELDNPWAAAQLHAAIALWGAKKGRSRQRAVKPFADENLPKHLTAAIKLVRGEGPNSAYGALSRYKPLWVRGLGPAYFTKLLYFAGYGDTPHMPNPLIMDNFVIEGLTALTKQPWKESRSDYMRYLDLAQHWGHELGAEPDVIERRLFQIGKGG
jgi:hypothetical protein